MATTTTGNGTTKKARHDEPTTARARDLTREDLLYTLTGETADFGVASAFAATIAAELAVLAAALAGCAEAIVPDCERMASGLRRRAELLAKVLGVSTE